jgi:hypothetical protein
VARAAAHGIGGERGGRVGGQPALPSLLQLMQSPARLRLSLVVCFGYPWLSSSDVGVGNGLVGVGDCLHICLPPPTSLSAGKAAREERHTTNERETEGLGCWAE